MRIFVCVLTFFIFTQFQVYGFGEKKSSVGGRDSTFIREAKLPWNFRIFSVNKISEMVLGTPNDSLPAAVYNPRAKIGLGVAVFYRSVGVWAGVKVDMFDKSKKTVQYDLQLNQYAKRFTNDLYFQYYEGIYLDNADAFRQFGPVPEEAEFRGDMSIFSIGLNTNYYLNWKRFSTGAPFIQSELQLKNAGSFIVGGSLSLVDFSADSSVIPHAAVIHPSEAIRSGAFYTATSNIGYAYTFVWGKYAYVNVNAIAGPGITRWEYLIDNTSGYDGVRPMLRFGGRVSAGYNMNGFFTGMSAVVDQLNIFYNKNKASYLIGNVRLFIGYRPDFSRGKSSR